MSLSELMPDQDHLDLLMMNIPEKPLFEALLFRYRCYWIDTVLDQLHNETEALRSSFCHDLRFQISPPRT